MLHNDWDKAFTANKILASSLWDSRYKSRYDPIYVYQKILPEIATKSYIKYLFLIKSQT